MRKSEDGFDSFVYIVCCILSLGALWITRVVITVAIRKAFESEK